MTNAKEFDEKTRRFIADKVKKNYQGWLRSTSISYNTLIANSIEEVKTILNGKLGLILKLTFLFSITANLGIWYKVFVD